MSTPGTVNYPATLDDAISLLEAKNGAATTLSADLAALDTTANVVSTVLFPSTGAVTLGGVEIAYYTGKTATSLTGLIRGADGTTAVAHVSAGSVQGRIIARHHTVLSEAIIAAETKLNSVEAASVAGLAGKAATVHTHVPGDVTGTAVITTDPRLSDARTPTAHVHATGDITGLITGGKITTSLIPALAINDIFTVANQAAMLALTAERGDVAIRSDLSKTFILSTDSPGTLGDWIELSSPADAVTSVNGQTGVVVLGAADVGAAAASHTHAFADLTAKPTTIGGYGITDFNSLGDARWLPKAGGTMTGIIVIPLGSAGAPSIAVVGDPDTGIFSPGADQLALATGGLTRATVSNNGLAAGGFTMGATELGNANANRGVLRSAATSVTSPGFARRDDLDTGLGLDGSDGLSLITGGVSRLFADSAGKIGIGITPTAVLHIKAGTATASTAPLKFTSGTLNTTAEAGAVEFLTDDFFATITTGAARKAFVLDDGARLTAGKIPIAGTNGRLIDGQTPLAGTKIYYVSDSSGGTVDRKLTFIAGILTSET